MCFLQIESKILQQQKDYDSYFCNTCFFCGGLELNLYLRGVPERDFSRNVTDLIYD